MRRTEYPLCWPANWPRTKDSERSSSGNLKATLTASIARVQKQLKLFGDQSRKPVTNVMISSSVTLTSPNPKDPGVAVYFTWDGIDTCLAVDRYTRLEANLQALGLVIEAERTKMRHGGLNLVRAAFTGYAALPAPSKGTLRRDWHEVLNVHPTAAAVTISESYRRLRSIHHPDRAGGDAAKFREVQAAYDEAKELGKA